MAVARPLWWLLGGLVLFALIVVAVAPLALGARALLLATVGAVPAAAVVALTLARRAGRGEPAADR